VYVIVFFGMILFQIPEFLLGKIIRKRISKGQKNAGLLTKSKSY